MDYKFEKVDREWFEECTKHPDKYAIREVYNDYFARLDYQIIDDYTGEIMHVFALPSEEFAKQVLDYCGCKVVEE